MNSPYLAKMAQIEARNAQRDVNPFMALSQRAASASPEAQASPIPLGNDVHYLSESEQAKPKRIKLVNEGEQLDKCKDEEDFHKQLEWINEYLSDIAELADGMEEPEDIANIHKRIRIAIGKIQKLVGFDKALKHLDNALKTETCWKIVSEVKKAKYCMRKCDEGEILNEGDAFYGNIGKMFLGGEIHTHEGDLRRAVKEFFESGDNYDRMQSGVTGEIRKRGSGDRDTLKYEMAGFDFNPGPTGTFKVSIGLSNGRIVVKFG